MTACVQLLCTHEQACGKSTTTRERLGVRSSALAIRCATRLQNVRLKNLSFLAKSKKSVFLPVFSRKPNSFRGPGGFCWRIGVTAALLGRLLPSDGHKLVKKPEI